MTYWRPHINHGFIVLIILLKISAPQPFRLFSNDVCSFVEATQVTVPVANQHNQTGYSSLLHVVAAAAPSSRSLSEPVPASLGQILSKAFRKGFGGGIFGAVAGVIQVLTLMWLRTIINYQSRYGTSFVQSITLLYKDGGIARFYRGLGFALFQAPITRFVATASNDGILSLLASIPATRHWGPGITTVWASLFVGCVRMLLMPIDTCKTVLQVDSHEGFRNLMKRVRQGKIGVLYAGSIATAVGAIIGHYPWFTCYNTLKNAEWLPLLIPSKLLRHACIGLVSSIVSDTVVNVFRVVKTAKQSMGTKHDVSYRETIRLIVAADGWKGLFGRGLRTRIIANALQSVLFTVIWRGLTERWGNSNDRNEGTSKSSTIRGGKPLNVDKDDLIDLPNHDVDHQKLSSTF